MSEYYAVIRSTDHLAHYGIKGMKWGVRKYIDKNGNFTKAALNRYGKNAKKRTSAKKMQRDFNRLDQSIANKLADVKEQAGYKQNTIMSALSEQRDYSNPNKIIPLSEKRKASYDKRIKKIDDKSKTYQAQALGIGRLQESIQKAARKNGYKTKITPTTRYGVSSGQRSVNRMMNFAIPGIGVALNKGLEKGKVTSDSTYKRLGANISVSKKRKKKG